MRMDHPVSISLVWGTETQNGQTIVNSIFELHLLPNLALFGILAPGSANVACRC